MQERERGDESVKMCNRQLSVCMCETKRKKFFLIINVMLEDILFFKEQPE